MFSTAGFISRSIIAPVGVAMMLVSANFALAQTPPTSTPPEKIDPKPVKPAPPSASDPGKAAPEDAQPSSADPLGVPARVTAARVVAPWEADGKRGFSRVIGVIDGERQRFYVQWLSEPNGEVVETKELEDEEAAKLTFGDVRVEPEKTGVEVFLDTVPDKDGIRETWVLVIGPPGDVRFGPATN